jgi:hypothetical protein
MSDKFEEPRAHALRERNHAGRGGGELIAEGSS